MPQETIHLQRGIPLCGEMRKGVKTTPAVEEVTCEDCKAALAVTKFVAQPETKPEPVKTAEVKPEPVVIETPKPVEEVKPTEPTPPAEVKEEQPAPQPEKKERPKFSRRGE